MDRQDTIHLSRKLLEGYFGGCGTLFYDTKYGPEKRNAIRLDKKETIKDDIEQNTAFSVPSKPEGAFLKKIDDKDYIRNRKIIVEAAHSVGIIRGRCAVGTGFRVGTKYVMTARHVVLQNITVGKLFKQPLQIKNPDFFIEFEYLTNYQKQNPQNIFYFKNMVYDNEEQDTAILELEYDRQKHFPPSITNFGSLNDDWPVHLIGHPKGEPLMDDPKIEMYQFCKNVVDKSIELATAISKDYAWGYEGIDDPRKCLFHCASQHGASGALGVMVSPIFDKPVGVLMLLRGFPSFMYSKNTSFSDEDKKKYLIVEQGVLLESVKNDMVANGHKNLKKEIFD